MATELQMNLVLVLCVALEFEDWKDAWFKINGCKYPHDELTAPDCSTLLARLFEMERNE